jgi:hypothetical protein
LGTIIGFGQRQPLQPVIKHVTEVAKLIGRIVLTLALSLCAGGVMATPISDTDIVTVNGKQWAQPELFGWATWDKINAVCPQKICSGKLSTSFSGSLDMDGWIWASMAEATSLLNSYGVPLEPQIGSAISAIDSSWAPAFFADGWRDTGQGGDLMLVEGLVADSECAVAPPFGTFPCQVSIYDRLYSKGLDKANIYGSPLPYFTIGAWFYRTPSGVPLPSGFSLSGIALIVLLFSRRKKMSSN